jgi:hypothetical protein
VLLIINIKYLQRKNCSSYNTGPVDAVMAREGVEGESAAYYC